MIDISYIHICIYIIYILLMIWAFRCSNMAPSSWTFAINLLPHAEISWGALISLVMLLVSQLYVRAYAQKAAATEAGSSLGSLVWHRHTPRDHKDAKFGWWMVMASVCSMYFWCFSTNMDQFGWTWMVLSQGHQFGKQPEATKLYTFLVNLSNSARYIYIYIYLNYVESINFCTRYHRGPLWRWNFLRPWHRHLRHKNCQALNAPEEVQWLDWWSLKNLRK